MNVHSSVNPLPSKLQRNDERFLLRLFALAIFVWISDFKSASSQSALGYQAALLAVYIVPFFLIVGSALKRRISLRPLAMLILSFALFMGDSSVVGLEYGQSPYPILVNLVPPFIYISAACMTYITLTATKGNSASLLNILRLACVIFGIAHVLVIFLTRGSIDITNSRYELLSGAVIPSLGIIAVGLVRRLSRMDIFALTLNLLISILSVTRTLLLVLAVQMFSVFLAYPSAIFRRSTLKGIALFGVALFLIVAVDVGGGTGVTKRWIQRITFSQQVGADPTALTRGAEAHFMLQHFGTSTETMLFGNGLAAVTSLTGPDASRAARIVGWGSVNIHSIGYGHEHYASVLFVAGLLGGGWLLIMQLLNGLQSVALIRKLQLEQTICSETTAHIGIWGGIIVLGMLVVGLLSGTLGDRSTCLWYGIGTGMIYGTRESIRALSPRSR